MSLASEKTIGRKGVSVIVRSQIVTLAWVLIIVGSSLAVLNLVASYSLHHEADSMSPDDRYQQSEVYNGKIDGANLTFEIAEISGFIAIIGVVLVLVNFDEKRKGV